MHNLKKYYLGVIQLIEYIIVTIIIIKDEKINILFKGFFSREITVSETFPVFSKSDLVEINSENFLNKYIYSTIAILILLVVAIFYFVSR